MVTQLASGVFKYSSSWRNKKTPRDKAQPLLYLWIMTYAATYNCIRHLPDIHIQYDVTSWVTKVGNALPAVAFPSRNQHTAVFTGPYPGPGGP